MYLTVEQVRRAACAWITGEFLPPQTRQRYYQRVAEKIEYYQYRNQQARKYHWKKTLERLRKLGINVKKLKSCVPYDRK